MIAGLIVLLALLLGMAVYALKSEIDRYKNFKAGQPLREWLIKHAVEILGDHSSSDSAQRIASFMLEAIYDHKILHDIGQNSKEKRMSGSEWDNMSSMMADKLPIVIGGIKRLALLITLDDLHSGNAIRQIFGEDLAIADLSVSSNDTHSYNRSMSLKNDIKGSSVSYSEQDRVLLVDPSAPKDVTRVVANRLEKLVCH